MVLDVHQHLWPAPFMAALRSRRQPPRLVGNTLELAGEPPYEVDMVTHDVSSRRDRATAAGLDVALVSLSSPLGVEMLPPEQAHPLLAAYHDGVRTLPPPFRAWAACCVAEPDLGGLADELARGCVGLQLPATAVLNRTGWSRCAPLLEVLERANKPLFIHPGAAPSADAGTPVWWPPVVSYVQQMHTAWFAFHAFARRHHPTLRVCFAMLAGLAPLHGERFTARGGGREPVDPQVYVETSSYGSRAVDATIRVLGIDVIAHGSDCPNSSPVVTGLGLAAEHAIHVTNPHRLLHGG